MTFGGTLKNMVTASGTLSVGALPHYTVAFAANGGAGGPGSQTKWYNQNLTLSSTRPTRTGYTFSHWSGSDGKTYSPGSVYTGNSNLTLTAQWSIVTYQVSYNANGGSGVPSPQTKSYGINLTLSTTRPTRANYNFKGWATSANGSVAYSPGGVYSANAPATLYAVWELAYVRPSISGLSATRCTSSGTADELGTYVRVRGNWSTDQTIGSNPATAVTVTVGGTTTTVASSGNSGTIDRVLGGSLSSESAYTVTATVKDKYGGSTSASTTLSSTKFPIDFKSGGSGVAIGKPAEKAGWLDVAYPVIIRSTRDAEAGTAESGALLVGDPTGEHLAIDGNELMAKSGGTKTAPLYVNNDGGKVIFGGDVEGRGGASSFGGERFTGTWIGLYGNHSDANNAVNRKGWIGHNGTNNLSIVNETGGQTLVNSRRIEPIRTLWGGNGSVYYMNEDHTCNLSSPVSSQESGIVLSFAYWNYETQKLTAAQIWSFFVPKAVVAAYPGKGHEFGGWIALSLRHAWNKTLFITDNKIVGSPGASQNESATPPSVSIANGWVVLYAVYGV